VHDEDETDADGALVQRLDAVNADICCAQRRLFRLIRDADAREVWCEDGARDTAHWLSMRYGISEWKARRWIAASHALEELPRLSRAFEMGELGIDKVVELSRFATPGTEARLIVWARGVSSGCIRRKADLMVRRSANDAQDVDRDRSVTWWYEDEGRRFRMDTDLPAACGPVVINAVEREVRRIPVMPGEDDLHYLHARRADALVALCSSRAGEDPDPGRATMVVHAPLEALVSVDRGVELEGAGVIHAETARRLLCNARVQAVIENEAGDVVGLGQVSKVAPAWMLRQLRYRDRECVFPGCGARRFTQAHHIVWWERGGTTDLENLALVCFFHHKLVHEYAWSIRREPDRTVSWFRPDGVRYRAGPGPPIETVERNLRCRPSGCDSLG
jgi:hypothetical protein